jgi:lysophospholipase L1-like esterase
MKCLLIALGVAAMLPAQSFKFDFGSGKPAAGYTKVAPDTLYTAQRGFGFEPGGAVVVRDAGVTSSRPPFYFSVKVPKEGNYRVTVTVGDTEAESATTIKAELRRLMVERMHTDAGQFDWRTFVVNVRTPKIPGGGEVHLKDREKTSEALAWDDRLTLEFTDDHPYISRVEIEYADDLPTVYIAGDSTSTDQPLEPYNSWGQMLTRFFRPDIAVANHGESGESLRGFLGEGRLAKLASVLKSGDWLMIQMGHNDQKETGPDVGAFTSYKADLKKFIETAREHGAVPVLITPVARLKFDGTKIVNSLGDYPDAVRQTAEEEDLPLIDLNKMSTTFYEALGPDNAPKAFADGDTTHHSDYGSFEIARCVVEGIRQGKMKLASYLAEAPTFDPAHPDPFNEFDIPAEPRKDSVKPDGH